MAKVAKKKPDPKQKALAKIKGLTIGDCTTFLDSIASDRDKAIAEMVELDDNGEFECDNYIVSEGDDNGAYVMGWRWVSFEDTPMSKICSCCHEEPTEKVVKMRDGTTDTLCETCLEDVTCPTEGCGAIEGTEKWGTVGDGFDGYCPSCADKREEAGVYGS